jgi:hypothetical protein
VAERKDVYQLDSQTRDDVGSVHVEPPCATIGEPVTLTFDYTVGSAGLRKGARLSVFVPYGWTPPQDQDPAAPGAVRLECDRPGVTLRMRRHTWEPGHFNQEWGSESSRFGNFWVLVNGDDLDPGDKIRILWGDRSGGGPGTWPAPIEIEMHFPICVWTGEIPNRFYFVREPARVRVRGRAAERLSVVLPSVVRPGEAARLVVGGRDAYGEVSAGPLDHAHPTDDVQPALPLPVERNQAALDNALTFDEPGVRRVRLRAGDVDGTSNAVEVRADGPRLFWGDPHVHTALSDGLGSMEEAYDYARNTTGLDFCALADHMSAARDGAERFRQLQAAATQHYEPGRFVTFSGYEGTRGDLVQGDVNVYFLHDDAPMLWRKGEEYRDPADVYRAFPPEEFLAIPHSHSGVDWKRALSEYARLFEVWSVWGNSEYWGCPHLNVGSRDASSMLRHGLNAGRRVGIVAGGDDHAGHSGNSRWLRTSISYHNGLTGVWADELTRESLFAAL